MRRFRPAENVKGLFGAADQSVVVGRTGRLGLTSRLPCAKIL
jgi:hypothetical protein